MKEEIMGFVVTGFSIAVILLNVGSQYLMRAWLQKHKVSLPLAFCWLAWWNFAWAMDSPGSCEFLGKRRV